MQNNGLVVSAVKTQELALEGSQGIYRMVEKTIHVPPDLVYKIGKGEGGYYASLYDLIAREMAMQFADIETISEDDYRVKIRQRTRYWNRAGKEILDSEEYEIDCKLLYEKARFSWKEVEWVTDKTGKRKPVTKREGKKTVMRDEQHPENPPRVIIELPDDAEQELYENFLTLRRNKLAKAITCARRRLIQRAIGIKKFSFDSNNKNWADEQKMSFYAFLPAEADRKAGIKAVHDLTDEELPEKEEKKQEAEKPVENKEEKPEEKKEEPEQKPATAEEKGTATEEPEKKEEPAKKETKGSSKNICGDCGTFVSKKVAAYSKEKYGGIFCFDCQKGKK